MSRKMEPAVVLVKTASAEHNRQMAELRRQTVGASKKALKQGDVRRFLQDIHRQRQRIERMRNSFVDLLDDCLTDADRKILHIEAIRGINYVVDTFLQGKKECQLCGDWRIRYENKTEVEVAIRGLKKSWRGLISVRYIYGCEGFITLKLRAVSPVYR